MQPPPENIFSACLVAARVSMFTRRRRGWMVTLFRDMQPPARKNFPACSGIFRAARRRMKTPPPGTLAVQTARPDRRPCRSPGPQDRPRTGAAAPPGAPPKIAQAEPAAGAEPGPPEPCRSRTRSGAAAPPGVDIGNSGRRNATPPGKFFAFPP